MLVLAPGISMAEPTDTKVSRFDLRGSIVCERLSEEATYIRVSKLGRQGDPVISSTYGPVLNQFG